MKKLFLRDGKLWCGEFPEEPKLMNTRISDYEARRKEYETAFAAAKDKAVEVVNPDAIGFGLSAEYRTFFIDGDEHNEPEAIDLPKGWDVEYFCDHFKTMEPKFCSRCMGKCPDWIARLVPIIA